MSNILTINPTDRAIGFKGRRQVVYIPSPDMGNSSLIKPKKLLPYNLSCLLAGDMEMFEFFNLGQVSANFFSSDGFDLSHLSDKAKITEMFLMEGLDGHEVVARFEVKDSKLAFIVNQGIRYFYPRSFFIKSTTKTEAFFNPIFPINKKIDGPGKLPICFPSDENLPHTELFQKMISSHTQLPNLFKCSDGWYDFSHIGKRHVLEFNWKDPQSFKLTTVE